MSIASTLWTGGCFFSPDDLLKVMLTLPLRIIETLHSQLSKQRYTIL